MKFSKLTADEESHGLYKNRELIGHEEGWLKILAADGLEITNHKVIKS